mmetsp:Transcript_98356/g.300755  ORF Transcript_98356/g.300755 Transcript_98356/m.300755 type:complete len:247 (+) Transcript_98356:667-1407(+)
MRRRGFRHGRTFGARVAYIRGEYPRASKYRCGTVAFHPACRRPLVPDGRHGRCGQGVACVFHVRFGPGIRPHFGGGGGGGARASGALTFHVWLGGLRRESALDHQMPFRAGHFLDCQAARWTPRAVHFPPPRAGGRTRHIVGGKLDRSALARVGLGDGGVLPLHPAHRLQLFGKPHEQARFHEHLDQGGRTSAVQHARRGGHPRHGQQRHRAPGRVGGHAARYGSGRRFVRRGLADASTIAAKAQL